MKKVDLPNKLTLSRVLAIPLFVLLFVLKKVSWYWFGCESVFISLSNDLFYEIEGMHVSCVFVDLLN